MMKKSSFTTAGLTAIYSLASFFYCWLEILIDVGCSFESAMPFYADYHFRATSSMTLFLLAFSSVHFHRRTGNWQVIFSEDFSIYILVWSLGKKICQIYNYNFRLSFDIISLISYMGKKSFKVYRTLQELGIQVFMKQSSKKFTELFRIKCGTLKHFFWIFRILIWKFCNFSKTLFRKCMYPQLLNSSINFTELFFPCFCKRENRKILYLENSDLSWIWFLIDRDSNQDHALIELWIRSHYADYLLTTY